ncbi:MAG: DNA topoisomerase (ATP-hydrolyzing) subunit B [Clostridiales bacterium]|jgi:DNA gyrase subunit B|nr:DNA topoisomerase (ATP-hydrolyzing) subunit B [Clostridiales bacterium]
MPKKANAVEQAYDETGIQVLKGLEPVRKRPGMYIGSTDERGLHHLVKEIVDNSVDEALAGYCDKVLIEINRDGSVSVTDNGRGIPTGILKEEGKSAVEVVLTKLHAGGKFGGGAYKVSGGLHGVGLSCVNALSEWLDVEVYQNGNKYTQRYNRGVAMADLKVAGKSGITGTKITFYPDDEIFETLEFSYDTIRQHVREVAFLNKGFTVVLKDLREGIEREDTFLYENGILDFVDYLNQDKETLFQNALYFSETYDSCQVEIAIQYGAKSFNEVVYTYANNINTEEGGTHLEGFRNGLTKIVNDYGHKSKSLKEDDKLTGDDVREGITAVVSVKLQDPQFEGQTKTKLGNSEMRTVVARALQEGLGTYLEENPKETALLIEKALTARRARDAARKARETIRKGVFESTTLPGKLADCTDKDPTKCEIYIVEGDSAGGTAKQGRDRRFQAILPLRGKILNVEKVRPDQALGNAEIKNMITAFGCGFHHGEIGVSDGQRDFDLLRLRYGKIILMTDADVDGSHIRMLLLTFMFRYMKELITEGHVYIAQPPLYKVSKGGKDEYCYDDKAMEEALERLGRKNTSLQRYKGLGEMSNEQLWQTTMNPENRILLQVTLEDAIEAESIFTLLMGDQPELRRQFIEDNADLVKELDI